MDTSELSKPHIKSSVKRKTQNIRIIKLSWIQLKPNTSAEIGEEEISDFYEKRKAADAHLGHKQKEAVEETQKPGGINWGEGRFEASLAVIEGFALADGMEYSCVKGELSDN